MTPLAMPSAPQPITIQNEIEEYEEPQEQRRWDYSYPPEPPQQPEMMDRNVMIMIFIAFIAGLLLGKIMNPVILRN